MAADRWRWSWISWLRNVAGIPVVVGGAPERRYKVLPVAFDAAGNAPAIGKFPAGNFPPAFELPAAIPSILESTDCPMGNSLGFLVGHFHFYCFHFRFRFGLWRVSSVAFAMR